jgi:hypothetical protein
MFLLQQIKYALRSSQHIKMKYSTVEEVLASFPHPILPTVQGEPDYQTIHANRKFLQANSRAIDTHLGGGTLGHLGLIISDASYAMIALTTNEEPILWVTTNTPRAGTSNNGWNSGPNQRRSPDLGRGCSDLRDMHLHPASIEEANHQRLRANVLGHLE